MLTIMKKLLLKKRLNKLGKQMFSLPDIVWESRCHVDEEATAKVCPEYVKVCEEYEKTANELNELIASGLVDPDTTIDDVIVIDKEYMKTLQEKQKEMFEMLDSLSSHCKEVYIYFRQPTEVNVFSILKDDDGKYFSYDETFVFNEASTAKESVKNLCLILSSAGIKTEILFNKCDANVSQHLSTLMSSILTN